MFKVTTTWVETHWSSTTLHESIKEAWNAAYDNSIRFRKNVTCSIETPEHISYFLYTGDQGTFCTSGITVDHSSFLEITPETSFKITGPKFPIWLGEENLAPKQDWRKDGF